MKTYDTGDAIKQLGLARLAIYIMNRESRDAMMDKGFRAVGQAVDEDSLSDDLRNHS